jgi:hypothetical protein
VQPSHFAYMKLTKPEGSTEVASIMAYRNSAERTLQAVMWHANRKMWMFAPAIAVAFLNDLEYMDRATKVDRPTAEQIAKETLHAELPNEAELAEMCDEGERQGWELGPPRE